MRRTDTKAAASFTEAPRQHNEREQNQRIKQGERLEACDTNPAVGRQKNSEARWTKKDNVSHFRWKSHVKADLKTKLVIKSRTTPASVHGRQVFEELLDDKDQAVLADSAYHTTGRVRVRVEHIFARLVQMGADWCLGIGIKRATQHNHNSNPVHNMDRYACLTGQKATKFRKTRFRAQNKRLSQPKHRNILRTKASAADGSES